MPLRPHLKVQIERNAKPTLAVFATKPQGEGLFPAEGGPARKKEGPWGH